MLRFWRYLPAGRQERVAKNVGIFEEEYVEAFCNYF
jgi:hypothetical protein